MGSINLKVFAWRNLWRNKRRTIITLSSIAFGTLLAVLFTGIGDATYGNMINLAAKLGAGHITIEHPSYRVFPSAKKSIQDGDKLLKQALQHPQIVRGTVRITGQLMLAAAGGSSGAAFMGLDPDRENKETLSVLGAPVQGRLLNNTSENGIVLGSLLAQNLEVTLGKKVVYTFTDKQGEIVSGMGRVRGIITTGADSIDGSLCLLPIDTVRELLGYQKNEATRVTLFVDDQRSSGLLTTVVNTQIENTYKGDKAQMPVAVPWFEARPALSGFITMKVTSTLILEVLILILIAAGIFNTVFVSVMERVREFGIMTAIGFTKLQLFVLVLWESIWLALCGLASAALIIAWPYYYLSTNGINMSAVYGEQIPQVAGIIIDPMLYVRIYPENGVIIAVVIILTTVVSGLYPAWKAGRIAPVDSIKIG